ncbi:MAG TPA: phosphatidylglycerophosphatase A [Myxococcota bacterium]|nr:phosphatidylglycerophosphatase A [Myxococcota bacterium]
MRIFILALATGGGSGYSPVASGTVGSLVGLALFALVGGLGALPYAVACGGVIALGIWAAGRAEEIFGRHDDGRITIDEVAGMLVSLASLPFRPEVAGVGFLLFRLFDIWKPFPARAAERLPGGLGVMADDLVAGLYANLGGQVLWRLWVSGG